jgi:hypothetical protein
MLEVSNAEQPVVKTKSLSMMLDVSNAEQPAVKKQPSSRYVAGPGSGNKTSC